MRTAAGVRQHTLLNLGRHFEVPRAQWAPLAQRIEALLGGQLDLIVDGLDAQWEAMAQQYAARLVSRRGAGVEEDAAAQGDYQRVDLERVEVIRPRSVGAEHVALEALRRLGLDRKLVELGFNRHQLSAAIGTLVGRMVQPGSELATHQWLQQRSGLGELLDYDFSGLDLMRLYRVSDQLLAHRAALEAHLYQQERDLFALTETITLYDLTNTFWGGGLLLVPQFTLAADTRKGTRASFTAAAPPEEGRRLFDLLLEHARLRHPQVETGRFGADMRVSLVNDGPVTFWLES